jgi:YbbR domain-containing protein
VKVLRWLAKNFGVLLTAFVLAVIVWVSSVIASDPNEERVLERPVPISILGQDSSLQIISEIPKNVTLVLRAPVSVWTQLNNDPQSVRAWVDLSNLGPGEYEVPVQVEIAPHLVRLVSQDPEQLDISLDSITTQVFPLNLVVEGSPPVGYQAQTPILDPAEVAVTGPVSQVSQVEEARLTLDITNANQTIITQQAPILLDAEGRAVTGLTVTPESYHNPTHHLAGRLSLCDRSSGF